MDDELVLIDGTNYAFRAFYAMPPMSTSTGKATGALYGFARMLWDLVHGDRVPSYLAIAFDPPTPSFRKKRYPLYKAQRKPVPDDLIEQLPRIREVAEAMGVPYLEVDGFEADDVIATLVARARKAGMPVRILSTDKDLMQLVGNQVVTEDTMSNTIYDRTAVIRKWGVPPERLRDLLALQGDQSDNIPGVPGIGPKTAKALLDEFHTVWELLERVDEVKNPRIRNLIRKHADDIKLSYELVTLKEDVPLEVDFKDLAVSPPDPAHCVPLFQELEFRQLLRQFETEQSRHPVVPVVAVDGDETLESAREAVSKAQEIAVAVGHTLMNVTPVAIATGRERVWRVDIRHDDLDDPRVVWLREVLADPAVGKVGHGLKGAMHKLSPLGITLAPVTGDTKVASYLIDASKASYDFWPILETYSKQGRPRVGESELTFQEAAQLLYLHGRLVERLREDGMTELYRRIELPLIRVLFLMERAGIRVDVARLKAYSRELEQALKDSEARIRELAGEPFNPASPKQLQKVLFEKLKLKVVKKTKTGPSTDQSVLEVLAKENPLPSEILKYRSIAKLKNTYVDPLPALVDKQTSRIHTTFNQTVASTGRLSSSDPNLQNIPVREEEGRRIRRAFVADPGCVLLSADYSQIELRLLAHFCEDETLLKAFEQGLDVHAATAAELFDVDLDMVTPQMRRSAKAINFGILYGMGAYRLARDLGIPRKEAQRHIDRYFERYARVRAFLDETLEKGRKNGYVTTMFGRRRYLRDLKSGNRNARQAAERMAINMPIQGTAADIIKLAMIRTQEQLEQHGFRARILLQVHDELVLEVPEAELEAVQDTVRVSMEEVVTLKCPLVVDMGFGSNWAEAH